MADGEMILFSPGMQSAMEVHGCYTLLWYDLDGYRCSLLDGTR